MGILHGWDEEGTGLQGGFFIRLSRKHMEKNLESQGNRPTTNNGVGMGVR